MASSASTGEVADELPELAVGLRVTIIAPNAMMGGNQGTILGSLEGQSGFLVRMDSGSIFNVSAQNLQTTDVPSARQLLLEAQVEDLEASMEVVQNSLEALRRQVASLQAVIMAQGRHPSSEAFP